MRDFVIRIKMLIVAIQEWKKTVWDADFDAPYCCSAGSFDFCGCGGVTTREVYSGITKVKSETVKGGADD